MKVYLLVQQDRIGWWSCKAFSTEELRETARMSESFPDQFELADLELDSEKWSEG